MSASNVGIVEAELSWEGAAVAAEAILALPSRPTAVVCFNDVLAAGLMVGLRRAGRLRGQDIAVVGLDDLPMAALTFPPLTSVAMHPERIDAEAERLLTRRLAHPNISVARFTHDPWLVLRESSSSCSD